MSQHRALSTLSFLFCVCVWSFWVLFVFVFVFVCVCLLVCWTFKKRVCLPNRLYYSFFFSLSLCRFSLSAQHTQKKKESGVFLSIDKTHHTRTHTTIKNWWWNGVLCLSWEFFLKMNTVCCSVVKNVPLTNHLQTLTHLSLSERERSQTNKKKAKQLLVFFF